MGRASFSVCIALRTRTDGRFSHAQRLLIELILIIVSFLGFLLVGLREGSDEGAGMREIPKGVIQLAVVRRHVHLVPPVIDLVVRLEVKYEPRCRNQQRWPTIRSRKVPRRLLHASRVFTSSPQRVMSVVLKELDEVVHLFSARLLVEADGVC